MAHSDGKALTPLPPEEAIRYRMMYQLLVEEVIVGQNTIEDELRKPAAERDIHYVMGQTELNVAFRNAAIALELSGLIDNDDLLCYGCGGPLIEHGDDDDHVVASLLKKPADKPN
jgi:hypothetical protein